ncbi:hypothetical protein, variant 2 [Aphanomyces invadans]|uniref:Tyrosine-protein kinase ephrin type A/B receptor-like domain-containing protein n=1 Tax=Aphanomyces invadans TaxID=157072 RepID=A0A024UFW6_9STRA|nr:hypothetical protein, variant 2 [Aphanomyces invadans]ETW05174.1 hypothetical protein, variant 2 [Aphanomyces invadans]|eukprot:XP_008866612.1 hypothetical protein, variant 2 [Aphanomyces invadans]
MRVHHAAGLMSILLSTLHGFVIDPSTPKDVIQRAFHCGPVQWIGSYNEFYQQCQFLNTSESVWIANMTLNAALLFADDRVLESMRASTSSYHIELSFRLAPATTHFIMHNASIVSSAVYIDSHNITVDARSSINTTAQGLKFGPGFNSDVTVGSAYGGTGGSALSNGILSPSTCADIDVESTMYIQPIGDLKGSVGDFRGYGSGGGSDATRGAGFVELNASHTLQLDGAVLANGGFDAASSASRSGSGGTIRLSAKILNGKGRAEACGGNATAPGEDSTGGGGGGGGGRVVLEYAQGNRGTLSVHVHGGTHAWEMPSLWCQEGGTGTYLEIVRANSTTVQGTIWIVGRRKEPPAGLMAGTPLFYRTARRELMVEPWMLHVRVAQHALVFASTLQLHANSSIEVEAGSFWATLVFNETIQLMASSITIAGRLGPMAIDKQNVMLFATDKVALAASAQLVVHSLVGQCTTFESDGVITATHFVSVDALSDVRLGGHLEVEASRPGRGFRASLKSRHGSVALHLDNSSQVAVPVEIRAIEGTVDLKASCVLRAISAVGQHVNVTGATDPSKENPILGSAASMCQAWPTHGDVCTAEDPPPFALSIVATSTVSITNSLVVSSLLMCSPQATVHGSISANGLGCVDGGPGQSRIVGRLASGGAGHGGAGGEVMPAKGGAGRAFEASTWPQWPGSSAESNDVVQGGKGGGLVVLVVKAITLAEGSVVSVRGGNGTHGGGGGSGGTIVLGDVADIVGDGALDLSGGSGSTTYVGTSEEQVHGGGGGGGVLWIRYQDKGSGKDFHGRVALNGGFSAGQTGFDGVAKGDACGSGCGGLFCLPCTPGTFSPAPDADCAPCPIGSFSDKAGATSCSKCPKGQFNPNPGSRACVPCAPGQYSPDEGAATCAKCPRGSFSPDKGQDMCTLCPNGTVAPVESSSQCAECGVGETTDRPGAVECRKCSIKPEHATYNQKGSCVYMCEKGHIGLDCLTPFEKFIQPIGGPVGFVLFCFVTILSVFGIYGYVSSSYGGTLPAVMKQYRAVRAPTPHSNSTHLPRLTDHQLTFHVARLYFGGRNTFCQPWHVPTDLVVGSDLRKTIYEGSYAGFASKCNAICTGHAKAWSTAAHVERLARLAVPPLATWMLRRYQRSTVKQLFEYMTEYGTGFFRDLDLQASGAHLILGYSSDYSLGYIDLLLSPDAARRTPQIPPPPLLFVAAGHGSFLCPFYLDTNDAWLRAVPSRVEILRDSVWLEFVAALNQHLRLLSPSGSIESILDHVEAFNSTDMLNGHTVEFGVFSWRSLPSDEQQSAFRPAAVVTTPTTPDECFERVFESKPLPEHSKWAIYVVPNDRRHAHRHLEPPAASSISAAPRTTPTSKPSPAAMAEMSSIRYAALYAPDPATVPSTNTTPLLSADDDDASTSRYRGNVLARRTMSMDMSAWTSSFLAPWSNVPVVATPYRWLLPYSLLLLLSMDFFTMLWILIEYFCIQVLDPMAKSTGCSQAACIRWHSNSSCCACLAQSWALPSSASCLCCSGTLSLAVCLSCGPMCAGSTCLAPSFATQCTTRTSGSTSLCWCWL